MPISTQINWFPTKHRFYLFCLQNSWTQKPCLKGCLFKDILFVKTLRALTKQVISQNTRNPSKWSVMAVNIPGVIVMVFFYLLVLATGMWAFFKSKRKQRKSAATGMDMALLGNRSLNCVVGIFTMTGEEKLFKRFFFYTPPQKKRLLGFTFVFM